MEIHVDVVAIRDRVPGMHFGFQNQYLAPVEPATLLVPGKIVEPLAAVGVRGAAGRYLEAIRQRERGEEAFDLGSGRREGALLRRRTAEEVMQQRALEVAFDGGFDGADQIALDSY